MFFSTMSLAVTAVRLAPSSPDIIIASFSDSGAAARIAAHAGVECSELSPGIVAWRGEAWTAGPDPLVCMQGNIVDRRCEKLLTSHEVARSIAQLGSQALADWAPPYRLAWASFKGITAVADAVGLAHWFIWQGDGVAAIASSATALARAFGLKPNIAGLGGMALTGTLVGEDSVIAGVRKLRAGFAATIADGRLTQRPLPDATILAAGPDALQAATKRLLAAFPEAEVELSGGWDSRLILASMARPSRRNRTAFTIGRLMDPDVLVAKKLAATSGMKHDVIDPRGVSNLDAAAFTALVAAAASRDDYGSNPLDRAVLNFINAARAPRPRFSGQNGEILRGFYYPGQPLATAPSAALAKRVIDWRIFSNDVVSPGIFTAGWFADMRSVVASQTEAQLLGSSDPHWADALDRYYLEQRMQRWCGTSVSAAIGLRPILMPFFDADVLALARQTPARLKSGSRFAAAEISRMDPLLGRIALDSGLTPSSIAAGGLAGRVALARPFAGKAIGKVRQKLFSQDRSTLGSKSTLGLASEHGLFSGVDIHRLATLGIFAPEALEAFPRSQPSRATAGFIMNCDFLLKCLDPHDLT